MKDRRARRAWMRIVLLAALLVNLVYAFHLWVVRDADFIRTHRGMGAIEKVFVRYPPLLGEYVKFLKESLPRDAVLLLPPGGYPFAMAANTTFFDYFLKPRKILTANRYDRKSSLPKWALSRGITHIAICRGTDLYREEGGGQPHRNVETNLDYTRRVEGARLPAVYMPEAVTVEARGLELAMTDGSTRDIPGMGDFVLLKEGMMRRESLRVQEVACDGGRGVRISAWYEGLNEAAFPEDFWGVLMSTRVHGVRAVRAELKSTAPLSVCLWTEVAGAGEWRLERTAFNVTNGEWQRFEISAPGGGFTVHSAGLCIRPLGWGYLVVAPRAVAQREE